MSGAAVCKWCHHSYRADRAGHPAPLRCELGRVVTADDEVGRPRRCGDYQREPGADDDR